MSIMFFFISEDLKQGWYQGGRYNMMMMMRLMIMTMMMMMMMMMMIVMVMNFFKTFFVGL